MASYTQTFSGLPLDGTLIRTIANVLEGWSNIENRQILDAFRSGGLAPAGYTPAGQVSEEDWRNQWVPLLESIERDEPESPECQVTAYSIGARTFTPSPFVEPPSFETMEALAAWIDERHPSTLTAQFKVARPKEVSVKLHGNGAWATLTVEATSFGSYIGVEGWESKVSPEQALDAFDSALAPLARGMFGTDLNKRVFLGHGHGSDWKILEEKIQSAGFEPQAFEGSAAAGDVNIYVIDTAIRGSFAAVLFMTPDDETAGGRKRARQNVIHEIGYAQGVLGVRRVILVQNEDVETPSNIDGVNVVRYNTGALYEKLEEVVGYLRKIQENQFPPGIDQH